VFRKDVWVVVVIERRAGKLEEGTRLGGAWIKGEFGGGGKDGPQLGAWKGEN
jgi:hypothetical protein